MNFGKRLSTSEPLTEHDVAERLSNAMLRVWRILADVTDEPVLHEAVRTSRFLVVMPAQLIEALQEFARPEPVTLIEVLEAPAAPPETF